MLVFPFTEHEGLCDCEQKAKFDAMMKSGKFSGIPSSIPHINSIKEVEYLGIVKDGESLKAHYYIGASWFENEECAFVVKPKVVVDYIKLFMTALEMNSENEAEYFSNYYHIDFEKPEIKTESLNCVITPLLILHYISLLKHLVSRGLKKGYVVKEENLQSKIRGRFLLQKHLTKNVFAKREDRVYCRFQEFTEDIPENRILKKALLFSVRFINNVPNFRNQTEEFEKLKKALSLITPAFENVSEDVSIAQVSKINAGKIFRHYESAIKVAKQILRHFDYSIDNTSEKNGFVRPFCIDMPRLYEMYVLGLLRDAYPGQIKFQVAGRCKTKVDFIKNGGGEKLILDAKYRLCYNKEKPTNVLEDIREISGYARDEKILKVLDWKPEDGCKKEYYFPKCVIIYPDKSAKFENDPEYKDDECEEISAFNRDGIIKENSKIKEIPGFVGFYKIAVPLPVR